MLVTRSQKVSVLYVYKKSEGERLVCLLACHDKCALATTHFLFLDCLFLSSSF